MSAPWTRLKRGPEGSPTASSPANGEDLDLCRVHQERTPPGAQGAGRLLYIETYGCQMNERDTEAVVSLLSAQGYGITTDPERADLIFVNTCSVRAKSEHKTYSELGRYRALKEQRPSLRIAMLGCVAQQAGEEALSRMPFLDLIVGTHNLYAIPDMLSERERTQAPVVRAGFHSEEERIFRPAEISASGRVCAFVTIMVGCDHRCTFCIVPQTRGPEISRKPEDVLQEIRELVSQGVREVMLLGQNVNSYGKQWASPQKTGPDFGELVLELAKIPDLWRIRFTSPHPVNVGESLYRAFAQCEKLQSYIHLPLQSGSDKILRRMKREYDLTRYREVVSRLRQARPGIGISTDFIVGFPGETEEDFGQSLEVLEEIGFDSSYSFAFSPRPGTAALRLDSEVPPQLARERLLRLQSLQEKISARAGEAYAGSTCEVLVEGRSRRREEEISGRTGTNWTVNFPGSVDLTGQRVRVAIEAGGAHTLRGRQIS